MFGNFLTRTKIIGVVACVVMLSVSCATEDIYGFRYVKEFISAEDFQAAYSPEYVAGGDFLHQFEQDNKSDLSKSELVNSVNDNNEVTVTSTFQFDNSVVRYPFVAGKRYDIFMSPYALTDIRLAEDDTDVYVILGDSINWEVQSPIEGVEDGKSYLHYYIRPLATGLITDCNIITNARVYFLRLYSTAGTAMVGVKWLYANGNVGSKMSSTSGLKLSGEASGGIRVNPTNLNFDYVIRGSGKWTPVMAYSDSYRTYVQFADDFDITTSAPALYLKSEGEMIELTNYIVKDNIYIVPVILADDQSIVLVQEKFTAVISRDKHV